MRRLSSTSFVLVAAVLSFPAAARAYDQPGAPAASVSAPKPALTLPSGKLSMQLNLELNVSESKTAEPLSIAPDVQYGVTPELTLAVGDSSYAMTGFRAAAGGGLCVTGSDKGCVNAYNDVGLEAWYTLARGKLAAAAVVGAWGTNLDAGFYSAKLGAKLKYGLASRLFLVANPSVLVAMTKRDQTAPAISNKDTLWLPVAVSYKLTDPLALGVSSGLKGPLDGFSDAWSVPLGAFGVYTLNRQMAAGASCTFGKVLGADAMNPGASARGVQVWFSYTL
jgi:hypothetical protein